MKQIQRAYPVDTPIDILSIWMVQAFKEFDAQLKDGAKIGVSISVQLLPKTKGKKEMLAGIVNECKKQVCHNVTFVEIQEAHAGSPGIILMLCEKPIGSVLVNCHEN